jgi:L-amino acid N-acyltransferase
VSPPVTPSPDWPGLRTRRLAFRPMVPDDTKHFHALVTRPEVARMLFRFPVDWPLAEAQPFLDAWSWTGGLHVRLAIEDAEGWVGWMGVDDAAEPEVFYAFEARAAGRGYATEAVAAFAAFLLARFSLPAVTAAVFDDNPASMRVLEKAGFVRAGQGEHASAGRPGPAPATIFRLSGHTGLPGGITLRDAADADMPAVLAITNGVIATTTAIWDEAPTTLAERRAYWRGRADRGLPLLVADGPDGILGFASFGPFRPREGYRFSVEHSVHVTPEARGQGIGRALVGALIIRARMLGLHAMVGAVTAGNEASLALHRRLGFGEAARLPAVGTLRGDWLDLALVTLVLDDRPPG